MKTLLKIHCVLAKIVNAGTVANGKEKAFYSISDNHLSVSMTGHHSEAIQGILYHLLHDSA